MKNALICLLLIFFSNSLAAYPQIQDGSAELLFLSNSDMLTYSLKARRGSSGLFANSEVYLSTKIQGDSRSNSAVQLTDNYAFLGIGIGYTPKKQIPGLRLLSEGGYSFKLFKEATKSSPDFRFGWMSYHEWQQDSIPQELYSEGIFLSRIKDFITQVRYTIYSQPIKPASRSSVYPIFAAFVLSSGVSSKQSSRFSEIQVGSKVRMSSPAPMIISVYLNHHQNWIREKTSAQEIRILASSNFSF